MEGQNWISVSLDVSYDRIFVGGEWRLPRSREAFPDYHPRTREVISPVARGGTDDIDDAVAAARFAFPGWRDSAPGERATILRRWAELIRQHSEELAEIEGRDVGKPISAARLNLAVATGNLEYA